MSRPRRSDPSPAEGPAGRALRRVRRGAIAFFLAYTVAVTWPGAVPFNRIRPLVLGLPFSLVWPALWIVSGCVVLFCLEWAWERAERERTPRHAAPWSEPPSPGRGPPSPRSSYEDPRGAPPGAGPPPGVPRRGAAGSGGSSG